TAVKVPLRDHVYDLDALLGAVTPRTKLVYVCHPNNPTGTANGRRELESFLDAVPGHEHFVPGRRVVVLRTFSKIYGLAGLRVGYAVAPADVVAATSKVRRAFDVTSTAQAAALASLDDGGELARRRNANAAGRARLEDVLRSHELEVAQPSLGNFVYA